MAKIKGKIYLKSDDSLEEESIQFKGIFNKDTLCYKENNIFVTIKVLNNKILMKRVTKEYEIILSLQQNKITENKYTTKNIGTISLSIKTLKLIINNNYIDIEYLIMDSDQTFRYIIKYELLEE